MTQQGRDDGSLATGSPRVPGTRRFDHVGLSVPDLEAAVAFFVDCFGAQVLFQMGRSANPGSMGAQRLGADEGAHFALAMLSLGGGRVELLQWWSARGEDPIPAAGSPGGSHIALEVADVGEALVRLARVEGVSILSEPVTFTEGPTPGLTNAFALTPWGALLEIVSWGWPDVGPVGYA